MVDRQDIDALLIGSLYGELSSADEAKLAAHLESHPADRTALADLTRARAVVRESRILQHHYEPPQSISALLMQEAARRAPKPRAEQSWLQRFLHSLVAHPAMAAAAMLVLIIGVAGTMYMKKGDQFARQTKDNAVSSALEEPRAQAPAMSSASASDERADKAIGSAGTRGAGSAAGYPVALEDGERDRNTAVGRAGDSAGANRPAPEPKREELAFESGADRQLAKEQATATPRPAAKTPAKAAPKGGYIEVTTPDRAPKDMDAPASEGAGQGVAVAGVPRAPMTTGAAPPPPPTAAPAAVAQESEKQDAPKADPELAWAKEQHGRVIAAVKAGNCKSAASLAVQISNRAPAYYTSNVETDRTLKQCMQYIADQRERDAERSQRAKATQQRATDEAPAPAKLPTSK